MLPALHEPTDDCCTRELQTDIRACRAMLRHHSRTFHTASLMLPRHVREPASALYAFCRMADDEIDLHGGHLDAIDQLRERLHCIYAGQPHPFPADRALSRVVRDFRIPVQIPLALLEGIGWDASGRRYETLSDLYAYSARVAGTVGAMMALVMGVRSPDAVARACDLGVAMQLSNIARDVGEDARSGRLYLPIAWLREAGIDADAWLAAPHFSHALGTVIGRLIETSQQLYDRAGCGIAKLPSSCRPAIHAARLLYSGIGNEIRRRGLDSVHTRSVVPGRTKLRILARALFASVQTLDGSHYPVLPECAFLVDTVVANPTATPSVDLQPEIRHTWWNVHQTIVWVITLFERLEQRDHLARADVGSPAGHVR